MKKLPEVGDWVTCVKRESLWVLHSTVEIGKSYQVDQQAYNLEDIFTAIGINWEDNNEPGIWVELDDFTWESEFEKKVREACEEE